MVKQLLKNMWIFIFSGKPRDFLNRLIRFVFIKPPGKYLGRLLLVLLPASYKSRLYDDYYYDVQKGLKGAILGPALDWYFYKMNEDERRRFQREKLWGGQAGKKWHITTKQAFQDDKERFSESESFLKFRRPLVNQIREILSQSLLYHTICEIGTGNGIFLDYLSHEFPDIKRFVGIDLNKQQIADNQEVYKGSRLEFVSAEIKEWVDTRSEKGTIFVVVNVLEYFSQNELEELLTMIRKKISPVAIATSEPVSFNLNSQQNSKPRGSSAYSHNYPYLFRQHGFDIYRQELQPVNPDVPFYNEVIMIAAA